MPMAGPRSRAAAIAIVAGAVGRWRRRSRLRRRQVAVDHIVTVGPELGPDDAGALAGGQRRQAARDRDVLLARAALGGDQLRLVDQRVEDRAIVGNEALGKNPDRFAL
jgi:hypothetical protein